MTLDRQLKRHAASGLHAEVERVNASLAHYGSSAAYIDRREPKPRRSKLAALLRRVDVAEGPRRER